MTDDDPIRRGDALKACYGYGADTRDRIAALPAVKLQQGVNEREALLWDLLEEIDAQIDLAEEISEEFAEKVRVALWESGK